MSNNSLSISELQDKIKIQISDSFPESYWIVGEIGELSIQARSGHCYMELIEKNELTNDIKAKIRATVWAHEFRLIRPYFETTTKHEFSKGIKILISATIEYHALYGLSLNVIDIDPTYTLGDFERHRLEIIKQLENEGIIDMNKELPFPIVPQRIAIISSQTAAGYGDFVHELKNNSFGYRLIYKLFPALMQGENAARSIIAAFDAIFEKENSFDVVALIRGGGSKADLLCFDDYNLASHIAQFPLPVLTGIGHERDDSIADIVAHKRLKTPTAVAQFLIEKFAEFDADLEHFSNTFQTLVNSYLSENQKKLDDFTKRLKPCVSNLLNIKEKSLSNLQYRFLHSTNNYVNTQKSDIQIKTKLFPKLVEKKIVAHHNLLQNNAIRFEHSIKNLCNANKHKLAMLEKSIQSVNPAEILKRGFTLTTFNGRVVRNAYDLLRNDKIVTYFEKGKTESTVNRIE